MFWSPRCLPPEKTTRALLREPGVERCRRWPARANRRTDSSMLPEPRLDLSPPAFACEIEAACASAASAGICFHEHDCGPLEHPNRRIAVGATARFLPSYPGRGQSPKGLEVRGRGKPLLDALRGDCSSRRLCPNPDRFERLLSRPSFSRPVRSDVGERGGPPSRRVLAGPASERVVRRRASAKKPDVHQPEAPSITGPFANERRLLPPGKPSDGVPTPFSLPRAPRGGRPHRP
jgi:hypothetical protein